MFMLRSRETLDAFWLINSDHGFWNAGSSSKLPGDHNISGFYYFSNLRLFRTGVTKTIDIEDLMPTLLARVFGLSMQKVKGQVKSEFFLKRFQKRLL